MAEKSEILIALEQIEKDKKLKKEDILMTIESALMLAYKKHVGKSANVEAKIDIDTGEMTTNIRKVVVENVVNPLLEISVRDAKKIDQNTCLGYEVKIPLNPQSFARIAAQTARQIIVQKIKESEKDLLFDEMKRKVGQIVNGIIYRITDRNNIIVDLGKTEAILPVSEQVIKEKFSIGQHIKAVVLKVERNTKGPDIILSRKNTCFVKKLFEIEVPEIYEKIVEIVNVVREAGVRTKVTVVSHNPKVDPVGACVGIKGMRVKPIIDELRGEKIDLVSYSMDPAKYVANSLSPAKVISVVIVSDSDKKAEVLIASDMLSLAIGRNGHNVRLAAKLTGWRIDVKSEKQKVEINCENSEEIEALN
ncbi:MAG: transcription termination factor NusA [Endomicrobium sp.]|jgi:N utilization substance protein A|nr:transcription termination factor NusA [Endomicrobium sp.]